MKKLIRNENIPEKLKKEWGDKTQQVLTNMQHEFKTPLSTIQLNAQLMEKMLGQKNEDMLKFFSKYIDRIMGESKRVVSIMEDTLYLVQLLNSSPEMVFKKVSVAEIYQELTVAFENYYPNKRFDLVKPEQHAEVVIDRFTFMGGMKRLISLVLEVAGTDRPKIQIVENEDGLNIEVEAPHLRIKPANKVAIFEPFSSLSEFNQVEALPLRLGLIKKLLGLSQAKIEIAYGEDGMVKFNVELPDTQKSIKIAS